MDAPLKKILRALSLELRHTLEGTYSEDGTWNAGDLERRLNQIGIWREEERKPKPISEMPNLSPVDRKAREMIDAYLALRNDAGVSQTDAVAEFIRESAYSWANRLFALRCMEARGIIDPVILQEEAYGGRSMVHNRFAQRNPSKCTSEDDGLFAMLSEEFQEHSKELPDLFAPDSPAVTLRPSVASLKKCIGMLSGSVPANGARATDEVFTAPDAFGWAYQYWNAEEKDRVFEKVRTKKGAKIEGADIIPATQLYTEPYMVKFLVQNSLGATWMMMHPESKLSAAWEYYVKDADRTPNDKKPVAEITFLDPACGSGHFHIEAFDLLYAMYEEEGQIMEPASICHSILNNNLFGIDIDERAIQITKAVLWMKAAETVFDKTKKPLMGDSLSEFHDHIIATNIRLPKGKDHLDAFLMKHPEDAPLRPALLTVFEGLQNVHELGSLVQIEEPVEKELKVLKEQAKQQKFDPESVEVVENVNFPRWKLQVMKRLKAHFQDEAEKALSTESFFSQSAVKGLALFDLLARRYDIVAANPPFMGSKNMGPWLKRYVESHYQKGKRDLYAVFILRNLQLIKNCGQLAMVTQQSWMFLRTFADIRQVPKEKLKKQSHGVFKGLLHETRIETLAHLGPHAFTEISGEVVNTALFTLSSLDPKENKIVFIRLIDGSTPIEKKEALKRSCKGELPSIVYIKKQSDFQLIPLSPLAYWLHDSLLSVLHSKTIEETAHAVQPISIGDRNHYIRYFWETHQSIKSRRWYNFEKGGGYCKWFGNHHWSVDWEFEGFRVKNHSKTVIRNEKFIFKNGLTYTLVAQGSLGLRVLENTSICDSVSPIIPISEKHLGLISILNCRLISYLLRAISPSIKFRESYVNRAPIIDYNLVEINRENCEKCIQLKKFIKNLIVDERSYEKDFLIKKKTTINVISLYSIEAALHTIEGYLENTVFNSIKFHHDAYQNILNEMGMPAGWFPLILGYDIISSSDDGFEFSPEITTFLINLDRLAPGPEKFLIIKKRLRELFEHGPGVAEDLEENEPALSENEDEESLSIGAHIPIPAETFLEELSQKMEIHPISIYWLLKEGIEKDGWRCIPEEKRNTEDHFTVTVLRLLGHRWPKQIEAGEPVPEWADPDGIITITSGLMHPTLLQQVRDLIGVEFPGGKVHEIEKEFEEVVGMTLDRWLTGEFFKHHISQFKKRPIAWQLSSNPSGTAGGKGKGKGSRREPAFSCLVYYHKIDADILHKIRTQYVGDLINRYGTELRALEGREKLTVDQATRKVQLDNWIAELNDFSKTLQDVADSGFESPALKEIVKKEPLDKWTSRDGKVPHPKSVQEFHAQEKRYDPDINDGVRVNIMPLQKAGLLAADVIAKKDVEKAIADRAEWRADERLWCREGKLPKCGWWE